METQICPSQMELSQFHSGSLVEVRAQEITVHLDRCETCCNALIEMDSEAKSSLQRVGDLKFQDESAYKKIESSIRRFGTNESTSPNPSEELLTPGTSIGVYQIEKPLGQGGMGVVYQAIHSRLNKRVALKVLPTTRSQRTALRNRFVREMQAVGALQHENIVNGFDGGEVDGYFFLAMELIDGVNLSEIQAKIGRLPIAEACEVARQVALGLDYIHRKQILHRDIKPSNIMISRSSEGQPVVKILDLGLARMESQQTGLSGLTGAGQILGTLEYMAPEQADNTYFVDERADLYSLGATLYKLLAGESPYPPTEFDSPLKMLSAIANTAPPALETVVDVPKDLSVFINGMLSRDPTKRPATAADVVERLTPYCQSADLEKLERATKTSPLDATLSLSASETIAFTKSAKEPTHNVPSKPGIRKLWLVPVLVIALLAGIVWLKTDGGYLKIETPPGIDVTVELVKDNKLLETIEVGQSKEAMWYRSGSYEVRLPAADQKSFSLQNNVFTLKYRRKQTVTITKLDDANIEKLKKPGQSAPVVLSPPELGKNEALEAAPSELPPSKAKQLQESWAKKLNLPIEKSVALPGDVSMQMVLIPPGEFLMGSSKDDVELFRKQMQELNDGWGLDRLSSETHQHRVRISQPFYLAKYEMTRAQWIAATGKDPTNRSYHSGDPTVMPVVQVSWEDTQTMLDLLNKKGSKNTPSFMLPTEAQWEYACRAGTTSAFCFGNLEEATDGDDFWYFGNANRRERAIGKSSSNVWGLFDMHGNVHEWVQDRAGGYNESTTLVTDPVGPPSNTADKDHRIFRGGSCWDPPTACRSATRGQRPQSYEFHALGLRLAMPVK